jgi:hypothetical protein
MRKHKEEMPSTEDEQQLAEFFESHRDDPSLWEDTPSDVTVPTDGRDRFIISFDKQEVQHLVEAAEGEGVDIIQFIRNASLQQASKKLQRISRIRRQSPLPKDAPQH